MTTSSLSASMAHFGCPAPIISSLCGPSKLDSACTLSTSPNEPPLHSPTLTPSLDSHPFPAGVPGSASRITTMVCIFITPSCCPLDPPTLLHDTLYLLFGYPSIASLLSATSLFTNKTNNQKRTSPCSGHHTCHLPVSVPELPAPYAPHPTSVSRTLLHRISLLFLYHQFSLLNPH